MNKSIIYLFPIFLMSYCSQKEKPLSVNGIWQQLGYGKIFEIREDSVKVYDICSIDCSLYEHTLLADEGMVFKLTSDSLVIKENIKIYRFVGLDLLPPLCTLLREESQSPVHNYEVLWNTFNENYCYFKERNIDWKKTYNLYKPKINEETTDLELYMLFEKMLSEMNDGHVSIEAPESIKDSLNSLTKDADITEESEEVKQLAGIEMRAIGFGF